MKASVLYPYESLHVPLPVQVRGGTGRTGCPIHAKHAATTAAVYTLNISILVVLIYSWRISANFKKFSDLQDVYYGVQIAYFAIIGTQLFMIVLSIVLFFGIYKERSGLVVPWIVGAITFTALEAVAMVYSNVLRDHVNREFDALCKAEVAFFVARAFLNALAILGVVRFYNLVRAGVTWKGPEAIEL